MTGYHCPMHPDQTSPAPGRCPICRMHLVPTKSSAATSDGHSCCSVRPA